MSTLKRIVETLKNFWKPSKEELPETCQKVVTDLKDRDSEGRKHEYHTGSTQFVTEPDGTGAFKAADVVAEEYVNNSKEIEFFSPSEMEETPVKKRRRRYKKKKKDNGVE